MRLATADHSAMRRLRVGRELLSASLTFAVREQIARGRYYRLHADFKHGLIGPSITRVCSGTCRIAQHHAARSIRTVARRIRRSKDRNHGNPQRSCEMQWPGISADEQTGTAGQSNEFADRAWER